MMKQNQLQDIKHILGSCKMCPFGARRAFKLYHLQCPPGAKQTMYSGHLDKKHCCIASMILNWETNQGLITQSLANDLTNYLCE